MKYLRARNMAFATALFFISAMHQPAVAKSPIAEADSLRVSADRPNNTPITVGKENKLKEQHTDAHVQRGPKRTPALKRTVSADAELDPGYVKPTLEYDEIIDPSRRRAVSSTISSEFALRADRVERAIQLARRSIKQFPDDMDAHKALAEALDRKLELQVDKDPTLFEECIKEWLVIMRNGVGFEKGTNWRGIGILDRAYGDDEYYEVARHRIKHLTGFFPKPWESNARFLKKVLRPAQTELKGKILKKPATDE